MPRHLRAKHPVTSRRTTRTVAIRNAIRAHVPDAIRELARLAHEAASEQARVAAINALIDRGYGNLKHATEGDDGAHGITVRFVAPTGEP